MSHLLAAAFFMPLFILAIFEASLSGRLSSCTSSSSGGRDIYILGHGRLMLNCRPRADIDEYAATSTVRGLSNLCMPCRLGNTVAVPLRASWLADDAQVHGRCTDGAVFNMLETGTASHEGLTT